MTKLPEKGLLDGTKIPETTTGEFRLAMGNIRQFLSELFGDESSDKETARQTLGIDLTQLNGDISKKADAELVEGLAKELANDVAELANDLARLSSEVAGIVVAPVGKIYVQFAGQPAPAELYGGTWENISSQYAGQFFRAEGENAATFGSSQNNGAPNITGSLFPAFGNNTGYGFASGTGTSGAFSKYQDGNGHQGHQTDYGYDRYGISFSAYNVNNTYGANEVRPYNSTIRIWKRTA